MIVTKTQGSASQSKIAPLCKDRAVINKAFAGVGRPLNESRWVSSTLKMAKRSAENTAIEKDTYGR